MTDKEIIQEVRISAKYHNEALDEIAATRVLGYDILPWMQYWWHKNKPHQARMTYVDPRILDELDSGQHWDDYHGYCEDDV